MKKNATFKVLLTFMVGLLLSVDAFAQQIAIKGIVKDTTGEPVIGYGSVKKDDLSGSVVAIKAEEMNKGAVTSPQELIMGKVPGLSVSQGDGAPDAGSTIRIRGGASLNASNDPLIVIDEQPVTIPSNGTSTKLLPK